VTFRPLLQRAVIAAVFVLAFSYITVYAEEDGPPANGQPGLNGGSEEIPLPAAPDLPPAMEGSAVNAVSVDGDKSPSDTEVDVPEMSDKVDSKEIKTVDGARIDVTGDRLSVDITDTQIGKVLEEIGAQAGFEVVISKSIYDKKLSTSFKSIDMERGLVRLLRLVGETNYFVHYDSRGIISRLEVNAGPEAPATKRTTPVKSTAPASRRGFRKNSSRDVTKPITGPSATPFQPPVRQLPSTAPDTQSTTEDTNQQEGVPGVPYVPPSRAPVYIPPAGQR